MNKVPYYQNVTVKSRPAEQLIVRNDGRWLCTAMLDNESGQIMIQSEYGNYAFCWSAPGRGKETLKEFLVDSSPGYISNKFGYGGKNDYFDASKTVEKIRADIEFKFGEGELLPSQYKEFVDALEDEFDDSMTLGEFQMAMTNSFSDLLDDVYEGYLENVPFKTGTHPELQAFMDRVWPHLADAMRVSEPQPKTTQGTN